MMTSKELGDIFKKAREEHGMTVEEACQRSRIHPNVIREIENGVLDRLGPVYTKSFLKKYAVLLGLDQQEILKKYRSVANPSDEDDKKEIIERPVIEKLVEEKTLFDKPSKEGMRHSLERLSGIKSRMIMFVAVIVGVIFFIVIFSGSLRLGIKRSGEGRKSAPKTPVVQAKPSRSKKKEVVPSRGTVPIPKKDIKKEPAEKTAPVPEEKKPVMVEDKAASAVSNEDPGDGHLTMRLKARGEVWVQVFDGNRTVFVGTLQKGEAKTIESEGALTVWTGKGENLDFVVNGRVLGMVADGVVRDINVSRDGIKVNGRWVQKIN